MKKIVLPFLMLFILYTHQRPDMFILDVAFLLLLFYGIRFVAFIIQRDIFKKAA